MTSRHISDQAQALLSEALVWDMTLPWEAESVDQVTLPGSRRPVSMSFR